MAVLGADTFDRADNAVDLGPNWTLSTAKIGVLANQAYPLSQFTAHARWAPAEYAAVQAGNYVEMTYVSATAGDNGFIGPAIYMPTLGPTGTEMGDFYRFSITGAGQTTVGIFRKNNAAITTTTLLSKANTVALPVVMRLVDEGTDLVGYLNGVETVRAAKSVAPLVAGGLGAGFYSDPGSTATDYRYDNWSFGDATPSTPSFAAFGIPI